MKLKNVKDCLTLVNPDEPDNIRTSNQQLHDAYIRYLSLDNIDKNASRKNLFEIVKHSEEIQKQKQTWQNNPFTNAIK